MTVETPEDAIMSESQDDPEEGARPVHMACLQQGDKLGIAVYQEASQEVCCKVHRLEGRLFRQQQAHAWGFSEV